MTAAPDTLEFIRQEIARYTADYEDTFAPSCLQILDKRKQVVALELNPIQRAIGAAERAMLQRVREARIYVLKGRQGGVTTDQQGRSLHLVWSTPGAVALTLADKRDKTDKIFEITRRYLEHFPRELLPRMGGRETREISFPHLDSHFYTETAGSARVGASLTMNRLHCSEFAHYDAPREVIKSATPSMVPIGSVILLETTASAYGDEAHEFWQETLRGETGYLALFFPWWECDPTYYRLPLLEPDELGTLEEDEQLLVDAQGLSLEQLKWRRSKMQQMGRKEFLQEYAEDDESCWMASGGLFYDVELLKALRMRAQEPERLPIDTQLGGALDIYSELREGERAIIGADTAEGGGGDRNTFTARAFPSWRKLAVYRSAQVEPKEFAGVLNTVGRRYRNALLVIEKNAHGITVLRHLRDDHSYPLWAIYHRQTLDQENPHDAVLTKMGWLTTGESKPLMLDAGRELLTAAKEGLAEVPSLDALRDAFGVHRGKDGKIDLNGKDVLVSEMLAWIGRSTPVRQVLVA
ncbi:MAG: hypothetical protein V4617_15180 [Gemmatimonadota bacterium]